MIVLPVGSWWDWDVIAWHPGELRLATGPDLTYAHDLELVFGDPSLVVCPAAFQDPVFREPTPDELRSVARRLGETPPVLVTFDADAGGPDPVPCLITAERLDLVRGTVYRYRRERLAAGERLASWVHPAR